MGPILKLRFVNVKPVSTNLMYDAHKRKTYEYLRFEKAIDNQLIPVRKHLKTFMDYYDEKKHVIGGHMIVECPKENIFVKKGDRKGCVNKRCLDIDNSIKTTTDAIFYNIPLIDDSQMRAITIEDILSKDQFFHINYYLYFKDKDNHYERTVDDIEKVLFKATSSS